MTGTAAIRNKCRSLSMGRTAAVSLVKQRVLFRTMPNGAQVLSPPMLIIKARVVSTRGWVKAFHMQRQDEGLVVQFERLTPPTLWPTNCP
jgi:hypothetical protein